jgi:hypothetical protein
MDNKIILSRGDANVVRCALEAYRRECRLAIANINRDASAHKPGHAAGYAMAAAEAQDLYNRVTKYCVDRGWLAKP